MSGSTHQAQREVRLAWDHSRGLSASILPNIVRLPPMSLFAGPFSAGGTNMTPATQTYYSTVCSKLLTSKDPLYKIYVDWIRPSSPSSSKENPSGILAPYTGRISSLRLTPQTKSGVQGKFQSYHVRKGILTVQ